MSSSLDPSAGPVPFLTADHRRCDELWRSVESAAEDGDARAVRDALGAFDAAMRLHFDMEEQVAFPALEEATGARGGPTQVMRLEHEQMRGLLERMGRAALAGEVDQVVDDGDTLLMLVQQHNLKEEGVLYPALERALGGRWTPIAARLAALRAAGR